jgi:hypothetical protein
LGLLINNFVERVQPLFNSLCVCWRIIWPHKCVTVMPNRY